MRFYMIGLLLMGILPIFGLLLFTSIRQREAEILHAKDTAWSISHTVVHSLDTMVGSTRQMLITISSLRGLRIGEVEHCNEIAANILNQSDLYLNLGAADLDGDIFCSGVPMTSPVNISDRAYFQKSVLYENFSVGEFQISRTTGKPSLNFGYPFYSENGQLAGVSFAALDLNWLNDYAENADTPDGTELMIIDQAGLVLADSLVSDSRQGKQIVDQEFLYAVTHLPEKESTELVGEDGTRRLYSNLVIGSSASGKVYVVVGLPLEQIYAESTRNTLTNLIGLLVVSLLAFGATGLFAEFAVLKRLNRLLEVTREISAGNLNVRSNLSTGRSELSELVVAVDAMAENLQTRARVNEERSKLLDASNDAIFMRDLHGYARTWNGGAEAMFGYSEAEIKGRHLPTILRTTFPRELREIEEECLKSGRWTGELTHFRKDDTSLVTSSRWAILVDEDNGPYAIMESHTDISQIKQAEEDRIAREVAEKANHAKSEFLGRMSHELRTPLNAILGFGQLLEMDELPGDQGQSVRHILKSGRHLLDLINEILDIARIEAGRIDLSLEPVKVEDAVNEVIDMIRPLADAREILMTLKIPSSTDVYVMVDAQRFKQVLLNIFSNAVKYNRYGGTIMVTGSLNVSGYLRLDIKDEGPGISADKMDRLFQPFDRLGLSDADVQGTGLGLVLSRNLIESMNGRLWAESEEGHGTLMRLELPLVTEGLHESLMAEVEEYLENGHQDYHGVIMYVEDNLANIRLVQSIFSRMPVIKLITAMQGSIALELAREHLPDLILLDVHLPDMNGADLLSSLKQDEETRDIPVIIISADATNSQVHKFTELGAQKYLTKPIVIKEFVDVINDALAKLKGKSNE